PTSGKSRSMSVAIAIATAQPVTALQLSVLRSRGDATIVRPANTSANAAAIMSAARGRRANEGSTWPGLSADAPSRKSSRCRVESVAGRGDAEAPAAVGGSCSARLVDSAARDVGRRSAAESCAAFAHTAYKPDRILILFLIFFSEKNKNVVGPVGSVEKSR